LKRLETPWVITDLKKRETQNSSLDSDEQVTMACPGLQAVDLKPTIMPRINPAFLYLPRSWNNRWMWIWRIATIQSRELHIHGPNSPFVSIKLPLRQSDENVTYFRYLKFSNFLRRFLLFEFSWETPPSRRQFWVWTLEDTVEFCNALRGS